MTWFQYMTSDSPFKEKENEYMLDITIGEALAKGIALPEWHKNYPDTCRIQLELEGCNDKGFSVSSFEKYSCDMRDTDKQFCAMLWYISTPEQAEGLLEYLKEHLKTGEDVELWYVFQGDHTDKPYVIETKTVTVPLEQLSAAAIHHFYNNVQDAPACMIVTR